MAKRTGKLLESRRVYDGRWLKMDEERVRLPGGAVADLVVLRHPGAAAVVPIHEDGTVTLIRQYRHAVGGFILEVPAGKLDPGDTPESCAARELVEEVGLHPNTLVPLGPIYTTPGFTDEVIRIYAAWNLTPGDVERDEDEFMEVQVVPWSEAVEMVRVGRITDTKSVTAILWGATFLRPGG